MRGGRGSWQVQNCGQGRSGWKMDEGGRGETQKGDDGKVAGHRVGGDGKEIRQGGDS